MLPVKWIILQIIYLVTVSAHYGGGGYKNSKYKNENENNKKIVIKSNQYRVYTLTTATPPQSPIVYPAENVLTQYKALCYKRPKLPENAKTKCYADRCESVCHSDYQFPNGGTSLNLVCEDGTWIVENTELMEIPSCEPICKPACRNNGICISPGVCECLDQYSGPQCENKNSICLAQPPMPKYSRRMCTQTFCTIQCMKGYQFYDGSTMTNLRCNNSVWEPVRQDWKTIPDCQPNCVEKCQNGGFCIAADTCQCLQEYRGPQCQFHKDVCSHKKLNFNGGYKCEYTEELVSCQIQCPAGTTFQHAPVEKYTCKYAEGFFTPTDIPNCVYGEHHVLKTTVTETKQKRRRQPYKYLNIATYDFSEDTDYTKVILPGMYVIQDVELVAHKKPAVCLAWNGNRIKTFDGLIYDAPLSCSYSLLQDSKGEVSIILRACHKSQQPCPHNLDIYIGELKYSFDSTNNGLIFHSDGKRYRIPVQLQGIRVSGFGSILKISLDIPEIDIYWDLKHSIMIETSAALWNQTSGLCGTMNGNLENDFTSKSGETLTKSGNFIESWRATGSDTDANCKDREVDIFDVVPCDPALKKKAAIICKQLLSVQSFGECLKHYDRNAMIAACMGDYCNCNNRNAPWKCVCNGVAAFANDCKFHGIQLSRDWRNFDICPVQCSNDRVYKSCGPSYEASCGSAVEQNSADCREGCFCPEGKIQYHGECVEPKNCPCFLRGKTFKPGSKIAKNCNTCTCQSGLWKCTDEQCGARCAVIGDPHYLTFDGKRYDFMGKCSYTLLKSENISIEVENVACTGFISESMQISPYKSLQMPSCTKSVTVDVLDQMNKKQSITLSQGRKMTINEQNVHKLPQKLSNGYIKISEPSSIYTLVELQTGIKVWWDGAARLYVDVPSSYRDKTEGLCGTFNSNANDDFLTPEGDIENQPEIFADKWRTKEMCSLNNTQPRALHPCAINVQNRAKAEKLCSKIKSNLFYECHWTVNPKSYYEDCMFDVCTCENDLEQCACPIIAAYASECARKDIIIDWTPSIAECEVKCPEGQVYEQCGSGCSRTCEDIRLNLACDLPCVEGCRCPANQTLDDEKCVPIDSCTCNHDGRTFHNGDELSKMIDGILNDCVCIDDSWKCIPQSPLQNYLTNCSANQIFTECLTNDIVTCGNVNISQPLVGLQTCIPGCTCKSGFIYDTGKQICILPEDCNCYHGGNVYTNGDSVKQSCNTCKCTNGLWQCTKLECDSTCTAWGDSHFETFDGRNFDFKGVCNYLLAMGIQSNGDGFSIEIHNSLCGSNGVTCPKSVKIATTGSTPEKIVLSSNSIATNENSSFQVYKSGLFIIVNSTKLGLKVSWDQGTRIYVKLDRAWQGNVKGLCGNYNGKTNDDFMTPSGGSETSELLFGDSWKLDDSCNGATEQTDACSINPKRKPWAESKCSHLKSDIFKICHAEVSVDKFYERCVFDTCACDQGGDCECLCTALSAYGQECSSKGVPIKWRTAKLCPMQCESNSFYTSCVSPCARETCEHILMGSRPNCNEDSCVEGCEIRKCPNDLIYLDDSYSECVDKIKCNSGCVRNGKFYSFGDIVSVDDCEECRCNLSEVECLAKPCNSTKVPVIVPVIPQITNQCNPAVPYTDYPGDCSKFKQCTNSNFNEWEYVTKSCGTNMMYNPQTMICDWPSSVIAIKPECGVEVVDSVQQVTTIPNSESQIKSNCSSGFTYQTCAVTCNLTCHFYRQQLSKSNLCTNENCIAGCVPNDRICDSGYYHDSFETCVPVSNCPCMGKLEKLNSGDVEKQDHCSECRCAQNEYECSFKPNCNEDEDVCSEPMGLENGKISAEQIIVSSVRPTVPLQPIDQLKLSSEFGWQPYEDSTNEFIIFNLLSPHVVSGIKTKGGQYGWVESFNAFHYSDQDGWISFVDKTEPSIEYLGNVDGINVKYNKLHYEDPVQYIKIAPIRWQTKIEWKVEIIGCFTPPETDDLPKKCTTCPGVPEEGCNCATDEFWNGKTCIGEWACPCVDGTKKYNVGQTFTSANCSKCFCDLNGKSKCSEFECPACENGQPATVSSQCECECKKCPDFSVQCPTSGECIIESKWCDGVQDCPDDETNCATVNTETTIPDILLTTVTDNELCPTPVCPDEFDVEILDEADIKSTVFKNGGNPKPVSPPTDDRKEKLDPNVFKSNLPKPIKFEMAPELNCAEFECNPKPNKTNCSPSLCPLGYEVIKSKKTKSINACTKFTCELIPEEDAVCEVTGTMINTFDGKDCNYDVCNQIMARDLPDENWMVIMRKNCSDDSGCTKAVEVRDKISQIVFSMHQDLTIEMAEHRYTIDQCRKSKKLSNSFAISKAGNTIILVSSQHGFWITFDQNGDVQLGVNNKNKFKVDGLCGYFDRKSENDLRFPDGDPADDDKGFGDSWAALDDSPDLGCIPQVCSNDYEIETLEICNEIQNELFMECENTVDMQKSVDKCMESTCECLKMENVEKCKCRALQEFVAECLAGDETIDLNGWRISEECEELCPAPLVYHDCYRRQCEPSCDTLESGSCPYVKGKCFPGCYCPEGTVRKGDLCVPPSECKDCTCDSFGKSQYVTYDRNHFTFNGNCTYLLTRDLRVENAPKFEMYVTTAPCDVRTSTTEVSVPFKQQPATCTQSLHIVYDNHIVHIQQNENKTNLIVLVDGMVVKSRPVNHDWIQITEVLGREIQISLPKAQTEITSMFNDMAFSIQVPSMKYGNKMTGICGNCNKDPTDDSSPVSNKNMTKTNSSSDCVTNEFEACIALPPNSDPCLSLLNDEVFEKCHMIVDPIGYISACQQDLCKLGPLQKGACKSIEAYVRECARNDICLDWRRPDFCPYTECGANLEYNFCGCPETCENIDRKDVIKIKNDSCAVSKTEGCFCPTGMVLRNGECIESHKCKPCDQEGHYPGDVWFPDNCTTCECSKDGQTKCSTNTCVIDDIACIDNFVAQKIKSDDECCPKYICIPKPLNEKRDECPKPLLPKCGFGQMRKLIVDRENCSSYVCECVPPQECATLAKSTPPPVLKPGMKLVPDTTGCCPILKPVCDKTRCPPKLTTCANKVHKLVEITPASSTTEDNCCKEVKCVPPKDKCLVAINGAERLKSIGEVWKILGGSPCITKKCILDTDNQTKEIEISEICDTACLAGFEYTTINGKCCGKCIPTGCIIGSDYYKTGDEWHINNDNCTKFICEHVNDSYIIKSIPSECPDISKCPKDKRIKTGCCMECSDEMNTNCQVKPMKSEMTKNLIREFKNEHGVCTNSELIENMNMCAGACPSGTVFNPESFFQDKYCQCCEAKENTTFTVNMKCDDEYVYKALITVPTSCTCH